MSILSLNSLVHRTSRGTGQSSGFHTMPAQDESSLFHVESGVSVVTGKGEESFEGNKAQSTTVQMHDMKSSPNRPVV
jgi:hypothetical protein